MRLLVALILLSLAVSGCKKDCDKTNIPQTPLTPRPPQPMIKTIVSTDYQGDVSIDSFYYDSLWRLVRWVGERTNPAYTYVDSFSYEYPYIYRNGSIYLTLNADSLVYKDNYSTWYSQKTYSFNSDRYQVYVSSMVGNGTRTYDSSNNMVEEHNNVEANPPNRIYNHHYYTYNTHLNTIGNYNRGEYHWGKSSVNLVERQDFNWHLNGNEPAYSYTDYVYTFNDSGWVSRMNMNQGSINKTYIDSVNFVLDTTYYQTRQEFTYY